jgi:hypothetical protein
MITTSPSAITAWAKCERQWWLERRAGPHGLGLKPTHRRLPNTLGTAAHYGVAWALRDGLDAGVKKGTQRLRGMFAMRPMVAHDGRPMATTPELMSESMALVEAITRAFMLEWQTTWKAPSLKFVDEPFAVMLADDVRLMVRHDLVIVQDLPRPFDLKLVERVDDGWIKSWRTAPQTLAYRMAVRELFGDSGPMEVVAMVRGARRDGKLSTPLLYGYSAQAVRPFDRALVSHERAGKMQKFEAWKPWTKHVATEPLTDWIRTLPAPVRAAQFRSIFSSPPDETTNEWRQAVLVRERDLQSRKSARESFAMTGMLQGRCQSQWGRCPFYQACHEGAERSAELYEPREPHLYEFDAETEAEAAADE